jgi:hypothetical protein
MRLSLRWSVAAATGLIGLLVGVGVRADIPTTAVLFYAGTLEDGGEPLPGPASVEFRLFDALEGGTETCHLPAQTIALQRGRFRLDVSDCVDQVKANPDLYVEITVDGSPLPRKKIGATPYAVEAGHATTADQATSVATGGVDSAAIADDSIDTQDIADEAIGSAKIRNDSMSGEDIANGSILGVDIRDGEVGANHLSTGAAGANLNVSAVTGASCVPEDAGEMRCACANNQVAIGVSATPDEASSIRFFLRAPDGKSYLIGCRNNQIGAKVVCASQAVICITVSP